MARAQGLRLDTVRGTAGALEEIVREARPMTYFDTLAESMAALDPQRIRAAARALAVGREVAVVVGDRGALEPLLDAAGYRVEVVAEPPEGE